jgi:hypothetical protein
MGLRRGTQHNDSARARVGKTLPQPTPEFRRRAWLAFQRALNPLAPPRPLRSQREP